MPEETKPDACTRPPKGWHCTRGKDHPGPCAAWPDGGRNHYSIEPHGPVGHFALYAGRSNDSHGLNLGAIVDMGHVDMARIVEALNDTSKDKLQQLYDMLGATDQTEAAGRIGLLQGKAMRLDSLPPMTPYASRVRALQDNGWNPAGTSFDRPSFVGILDERGVFTWSAKSEMNPGAEPPPVPELDA